ncbi:aBC transporter efflux, DrrB family protein [Mycobacterium xenopi 3993]|nr:aBC transporter efflux, DrrB family protein [Mycobacterium xenopi 3993]
MTGDSLFPAGTFAGPATQHGARMLAAQSALELKLWLRNGEYLLLTLFIRSRCSSGSHCYRSSRPRATCGDHGLGGDLDRFHCAGHRGGLRPALRRAKRLAPPRCRSGRSSPASRSRWSEWC